jgi:hypothetical protein
MKYLVKWAHEPSDSKGIWLLTEHEFNTLSWDIDILDYKAYSDHAELFRVIIAGSRNFNNYELLKNEMDYLLQNKVNGAIVIVSGKARGADSLGERYAQERGYFVDEYPADWNTYGKSAGYRRNVQMAENADALVLFWDGFSKGSGHMLNIAREKGLPHRVVYF